MHRYNPTDTPMILGWFEARAKRPMPVHLWPALGFVVDDVAAGFAYVAEGKMALLEFTISNPAASREARRAALDDIYGALLSELKEMGVFGAVAVTDHPGIRRLAENAGATIAPNSTVIYWRP